MTQPTPGERKAFTAAAFDRASATYDDLGVEYFAAFGRRLVDLTGPRPGDRVFDAGCGRGAATFPAAEAVGPTGHVLAIDLAPGMVRRTREEAERRGLAQVDVRVGDAESPDGAENPFDVVLSAFVLFMLPDPRGAMARYRALLRDGGRLGVSRFPQQPDSAWMRASGAIMRHFPGGPWRPPEDTPFASDERLETALRDAGFAAATTVTEAVDVTFRDREHWWQWAWSQGQRMALENVPEAGLPALKDECFGLLAEEVRPDGTLLLRQYGAYTVATA